jgi:nucleotide-binding universal stress UspA family protein
VRSLTDVAIALAKKHNAEIIFLHVVEVHEGKRLATGLDETTLVKPAIDEAEIMASQARMQARSIIKVSHRISQGIIDTAIEEECNFIVIGRQKNPIFTEKVFSSLIDTVLQKVPIEAAILHGEIPLHNIKTILIPYGTNIHTRFAMEIAPALGEYFNAKLKIAIVFEQFTPKEERDEKIQYMNELIQKYSLPAELSVVREEDVLKGIAKLTKDADLVLMGGRTGDFMELLFAKSLTQEITEQVKCPVIWAKEYEERESFWSALMKPRKAEGDKNG